MKKTFKKVVTTYTTQDVEVDLPEEPIFVQSWNYRRVMGIYPVRHVYDTPYFTYKVYIGEDGIIRTFELQESDLKEPPKDFHQLLAYKVIVDDKEYDSKIANSTFLEYYERYKAKLNLPLK